MFIEWILLSNIILFAMTVLSSMRMVSLIANICDMSNIWLVLICHYIIILSSLAVG